MRAELLLSGAAALAVLAGCTVGPNYKTPNVPMPAAYTEGLATTRPAATTQPVDLERWWRSLDDPELDSLVQRAIKNNLDLQIALDRLQEARSIEDAVSGVALPGADFSGSVARGTGTNSTRSRVGGPLNAATDTSGLREITEVAGFDAGWELDLFGRYRRELEAAGYDTQAAAEERNAVLIAVVSDVARAYLDTRTLQLRLAIAEHNIATELQTVNFVNARLKQGIANQLDVALAVRELDTVKAEVAPLEAELAAAKRRVAVLLGLYPEQLMAELDRPMALPGTPAMIEPGLPVALLRRRPDILLAERQLAAATARIGVATADLFPTVGVTAGMGLQGQGFGRSPNESSFIWSAGPEAYWPLLDFGTLDSLIEVQNYKAHEQLVNYKRTILNAVEEVDDAMTNYRAAQERLQGLGDALAASQQAFSLASQRYDRGLTDFLNVLDAERQLYDLQDQYAVAQEDVVLNFIAVYKGLGGGWEDYQKIPPIRQPQPAIVAAFEQLTGPDAAYKQ